MAELNPSTAPHKKGPGVKKGKKLSTRVDLTPMVDLGFLLITFFIFTTEITRPTAMKLILPKGSKDSTRYKASAVMTLLPGKNNEVYYYEGMDPAKMQSADIKAVRTILLDKKRRTDTAWFTVILKPTPDATYGNTVAVLDEMLIDDIKHYAFTDISPYEKQLIDARQ
jgi:biopolymer transport protein ExbD